jgi:pimeloyl-ACP methyl ester carboxylesterase
MRPLKIVTIGALLLLLAAGCAGVPVPSPGLEPLLGEPKIFDYHGVRINYYEAGQGPPVILLHGFGASAYSWRFLGPVLARDHRVLTIDLKGFGLSAKPEDGKYAIRDQADLVAEFIRTRDLHELVVIGHSMGGGVTLMTYFKVRGDDPARIKKLVLIDSAGYPQKMPLFIWLANVPGLGSVGGQLISPRFVAARALRKCYYHKDRITDEQIDTYAYYGSLPGAREAVIATAQQIMPEDIEAVTACYQTINVPVLIIWGAEDEVVPLSVGKQFKRDIPNSELVILPECGHMPPEEEAQETNRLITQFLKE